MPSSQPLHRTLHPIIYLRVVDAVADGEQLHRIGRLRDHGVILFEIQGQTHPTPREPLSP